MMGIGKSGLISVYSYVYLTNNTCVSTVQEGNEPTCGKCAKKSENMSQGRREIRTSFLSCFFSSLFSFTLYTCSSPGECVAFKTFQKNNVYLQKQWIFLEGRGRGGEGGGWSGYSLR